ncbi:MAG: O-antigen ligase family protein [Chthoniobacteraceae bacterium]
MSIRVVLLSLVVLYFSIYAWKNWFVSLCATISLLAVVQHPDFPSGIGGIQGLNLWNILLLNVVLAWHARPRPPGQVWDLPRTFARLLIAFFVVVIISALRLMIDPPVEFTRTFVFSEKIVNSIKWVIPGLLLFDACRTRERITAALFVILLLYFLLAVQVIRWMPLSSAVSGNLAGRASKITQNEIGYNRVTLSMMLAGACWAVVGTLPLVRRRWHKLALLGVAGAVALAQALTGGRIGYAAWGMVGTTLGILRWRKFLFIVPVVAIVVGIAFPKVRERMFQGFGGEKGHMAVETSEYEMTSGRNLAWPRVLEKIGEAPLLGYGREAMTSTGIAAGLWEELGESFPHPHQAYFEVLLDNGAVGFFLMIPVFFYSLWQSARLLLDRSDPLICAVGCASFSLLLALMLGSLGGQTFYPREGAVGLWAAIGLMMRVSVERARALRQQTPFLGQTSAAPIGSVERQMPPMWMHPPGLQEDERETVSGGK